MLHRLGFSRPDIKIAAQLFAAAADFPLGALCQGNDLRRSLAQKHAFLRQRDAAL